MYCGFMRQSFIKLVKQKLQLQKNFLIRILLPKLLLCKINKEEETLECGFFISNLETGIYYCKYDFGREFKLAIAGFGISLWWNPDL